MTTMPNCYCCSCWQFLNAVEALVLHVVNFDVAAVVVMAIVIYIYGEFIKTVAFFVIFLFVVAVAGVFY